MESLREDSAADLPPAHERTLLMTRDEIIERALREAGVFPPSALDRRYADRTELTRAELIVRSLEEMGLLSLSEQDPLLVEKIRRIPIVVAGLQLRLPDADITVCGAFSALNVGCCNACHTDPLHGMRLAELPCCAWAWLCCAVDAASSPEPVLIFHEREQEPSEGKMPTGRCGKCSRRED
jgi:hypothetical protein